MKTYNVSPYFDDFDEFKDYHQVMFKPGYAIQARELTQMQTILRNQIEKFGNHIFKHG
jgi:enamine deaminase RidA (YjgF/YER057c/UK114 family)